MYFDELALSDEVLDALWDMHFDTCTPVQEQTIPVILEGHDVISCAQTGTGKTAAYILPLLTNLQYDNHDPNRLNAIIMAPTRELAQQIDQALQGFSYHLPYISSVAVYGGNDGIRYEQEKRSMQQGADIVIATPGRLISHLSLGNIDLSRVSFFILDEADRMLDMGFSDDILQIAKHLPEKRQTIMFSATMPEKIRQLAKSLLHDPVEIRLAVSRPADKIHQMAYICYEAQKIGIIKELFKARKPERVIIFTGSKVKAKDLAISLTRAKFNCRAMHSDLSQQERDEVMYLFRSAQTDILVATDIVARGIDIDDITLVINFDVPHDAEDYVHRIGRTARAGAGGSAITLVSEKDQPEFKKIEQFLEKEVEKIPVPEHLGQAPEYTAKREGARSGKSRRDRNGKQRKHGAKKQAQASQTKSKSQTAPNSQAEGNVKPAHRKARRKKNHDTPKAQSSETQKKVSEN